MAFLLSLRFLRLLAVLSGCSVPLFAASVTATLDRTNIMAGETINLSLTAEGGNPQPVENFSPPSGLSIQFRGTSQSMAIINGQGSVKNTLNYSVSAREPGQYTIPAIRVRVDGAIHSTVPLQLTVTKADPSTQNRYAFLRLNVPKTEIYVGEILPIELQLYVIDAEDLQAPQLKSDAFAIQRTHDESI